MSNWEDDERTLSLFDSLLGSLKNAEKAHERGFDAGYSAAIHDARVPGSRAYEELQTDRKEQEA